MNRQTMTCDEERMMVKYSCFNLILFDYEVYNLILYTVLQQHCHYFLSHSFCKKAAHGNIAFKHAHYMFGIVIQMRIGGFS